MDLIQKKVKDIGKQWSRQRILKKQDIPTPQSIIYTAKSFPELYQQVLFAITYLTAGRISEVVKCKYLRKNIYKTELRKDKHGIERHFVLRNEHGSPMIERVDIVKDEDGQTQNYPGILKRDITFGTMKEKDIMTISMQNRKNKKFIRKNIPITIAKEPEMVELVREYLATLGTDDTPLFDFTTRKAEYIMEKTQYNPHFLRDIRLTHMVMIYNFNAFQLTKFAGWQDIKPAEKYVRLGIGDIVY